ncbi:hypothetical protein F4819DRAFT_442295 [Hypoxylon fuscum]|nr:hypothetical protein F4819DRAFT_442295 [Hypoxylon fuscum]
MGNIDGNEFSRANVVGLFITLSISLLLQPNGSLLWARPAKVPGRILFFLWRLNPFACFTEAVLIIIILIDGVITTLKVPPRSWTGFWRQLQTIATATALLRSKDHIPDHWGLLTVPRQTEALGSSTTDACNTLNVITGPLRANGVDTTSQDTINETATGPVITSPPLSHVRETPFRGYSMRNGLDRENHPRITQEDTQSGIANFNSASDSDRTVLSSNVRTRADLVINILSTIAVALNAMKLVAVTVPSYIYILGGCMVVGWAVNQLLFLISSSSEDFVEPKHLAQCTIALDEKMKHPDSWLFLFLPYLSGYLIYFVLITNDPLFQAYILDSDWITWLRTTGITPILAMTYLMMMDFLSVKTEMRYLSTSNPLRKSLALLSTILPSPARSRRFVPRTSSTKVAVIKTKEGLEWSKTSVGNHYT